MRYRIIGIFIIMIALLDQTTLLYILLSISALSIILIFWIIRLEIKVRRFTKGKNGKSLEETILHLKQEHQDMTAFRDEMEHYLKNVEQRLHSSIRSIETVRFNPFNENSGNQSFATAFADESGNGVILSSIYARNRMSVFAKPILKFTSSHELTTEEKETIDRAKKKLNKNDA